MVERDKTIARLLELETKAAKAVVLETQLQQSEQEVEALSQEIARLRVQFEEAKAKGAEGHNVVLAASNHEATCAERLTNLEAALNSKTEELATAGVKYVLLEEKYKNTIEHNIIFNSTVRELDVSLKSVRSVRENLYVELNLLKEELRLRVTSFVVEKPYIMYNIRRKTLEEAKAGIIDFDAEITKARELELADKRGFPTGLDASYSSGFDSETSGTEEESKGKEIESQTDEVQDVDPSVDLPIFPGGVDTSLLLASGDATV
ncbi:uncharacterized protein LOC107771356 [Nicotiana tabacum]|uniref:Uncharacterized protein LOC107771356 n=2 Tax=Nicotiana TaxID=4085 RepID=A0A1S3Y2I5_TOBAC|nr:PREDICTED: uncharacterized protein LOC104237789 [Nicotiana sylvestris]XP_016446192.1 PREDICTED: uncharacterized protein LOC107771356 [Nicotiana tabacum]